MENMDSITTHFQISQAIGILIELLILITCVVIVIKKKSIGTYTLLIGAILNLFSFFGFILISILAKNNPDNIMNMQVILSYFNNVVNIIFAIGLLLFATNDLKKTILNV